MEDPEEWKGCWEENGQPHEEEEQYWGDLSGKKLNPEAVRKAREEELRLIDSKPHVHGGGRGRGVARNRTAPC